MTTPTPEDRSHRSRPQRDRMERPSASGGHPAGKAALLMVGIVLLIVLLAAAPLVFG